MSPVEFRRSLRSPLAARSREALHLAGSTPRLRSIA
jgi:hypothetical protein